MGSPHEGGDLVFAMGVEFNVAQHHDVIIAANIGKGALQHFCRVYAITFEILQKCLGDAAWGIEQAFTGRIIPGPGQKGANRGFRLFLGRTRRIGILGFAVETLNYVFQTGSTRAGRFSDALMQRT